MKSSKRLFFYLTLFAVAMLTACGKVPEPEEKDVLKALEKEGYVTDTQVDDDEFSVQMNEVEIDDDKESSTVECVVSREDEFVRINTEYKIKFKIRDDKESWRVKKVTQNETTYELINPISDESLESVLSGYSFEAEGSYIYFYDENTTYTVIDHELRSDEMTDVVTIEVNGRTGYKNVTATIKYTLYYDYYGYGYGYWTSQDREIIELETTYVDGYEVTLSEERVVEDLTKKNSSLYMLGCYYYLTDESVTISNVRIGENEYDEYYMYVPVSITVNCENSSFDVNYKMEYYFDSYDVEWECRRSTVVEYANYNGEIIGVWSGTSDDGQVVLTINNSFHAEKTSYLDVIVNVTTSTNEVYSYSAYVYSYNPVSGALDIRGYDWIEKPTGSYYKESFDGYCLDGVFESDDYWYDFTLTKN